MIRRLEVAGILIRPERIAAREIERVEKLILDAPVAPAFKSRNDGERAISAIMFPGSQLTAFEQTQIDGSKIEMWCVEIPRRNEDRYFAFRSDTNGYLLIDSFVLGRQTNEVNRMTLKNEHIEYRNEKNASLREKQL